MFSQRTEKDYGALASGPPATAEPPRVVGNLGPYQKDFTTGESGFMKDKLLKLGGAIGVGLEIDFSIKKFWDAHLRNLACLERLREEQR